MGDVVPLPARTPLPTALHGESFDDVRGEDRSLRVSWHQTEGLVVLSLWQGDTCRGTFRLATRDLPTLLRALTDGPLGR
jgi:hypothetical protein